MKIGDVIVDLVTSDPEETNKEGDKGDEADIVAIPKVGTSETLSLYNSFAILNEDGELPMGGLGMLNWSHITFLMVRLLINLK